MIKNRYSTNEKRIIVAILIAIMEADLVIDPRETDFLDGIINSFNMSETDLDAIEELDFNITISDFKKFEADKKEEAIALFLEMAKCDGYADPRELKIIDSLGE